jgi:hypothetical protein
VGGWIRGISSRAAAALQPKTCYRNAIIGSTAAHSLWYINNDASFDVSQFAASFLQRYMHSTAESHDRSSVPQMLLKQRESSTFSSCSPSRVTVLIIQNTKLRPHMRVASRDGGGEFDYFVPSAWTSQDVAQCVRNVTKLSAACVRVRLLLLLLGDRGACKCCVVELKNMFCRLWR